MPKAKSQWVAGKHLHAFFKKRAAQGSPIRKKESGRAFAALILEDLNDQHSFSTIQEAVSFLPKVYGQYVRGEGSGIWKTEDVSDGAVTIKENSVFDCLFTEGLLSGLLSALDARGAMVKELTCRNDNESTPFCVWELVWMKRNKS